MKTMKEKAERGKSGGNFTYRKEDKLPALLEPLAASRSKSFARHKLLKIQCVV